jgi:hypothetical protein
MFMAHLRVLLPAVLTLDCAAIHGLKSLGQI